MPKVVKVTPAQVSAAKLKIKRSTASGQPVTPSVSRIANATRSTMTDREQDAPTPR